MRNLVFLLVLVMLAATAHPVHAQVAGFDCDRARTPTEQAICHTPSLGKKDVQMATYFHILQNLNPAQGLAYRDFFQSVKDQQMDWVRIDRARCEASIHCLEIVYDERLAALEAILMKNGQLSFARRCATWY
jgi:uncharacterized protein